MNENGEAKLDLARLGFCAYNILAACESSLYQMEQSESQAAEDLRDAIELFSYSGLVSVADPAQYHPDAQHLAELEEAA